MFEYRLKLALFSNLLEINQFQVFFVGKMMV